MFEKPAEEQVAYGLGQNVGQEAVVEAEEGRVLTARIDRIVEIVFEHNGPQLERLDVVGGQAAPGRQVALERLADLRQAELVDAALLEAVAFGRVAKAVSVPHDHESYIALRIAHQIVALRVDDEPGVLGLVEADRVVVVVEGEQGRLLARSVPVHAVNDLRAVEHDNGVVDRSLDHVLVHVLFGQVELVAAIALLLAIAHLGRRRLLLQLGFVRIEVEVAALARHVHIAIAARLRAVVVVVVCVVEEQIGDRLDLWYEERVEQVRALHGDEQPMRQRVAVGAPEVRHVEMGGQLLAGQHEQYVELEELADHRLVEHHVGAQIAGAPVAVALLQALHTNRVELVDVVGAVELRQAAHALRIGIRHGRHRLLLTTTRGRDEPIAERYHARDHALVVLDDAVEAARLHKVNANIFANEIHIFKLQLP